MIVVHSGEEENKILHSVDPRILDACYMTEGEKEFLNSMVLRKKPRKMIEIGVAAGGSTGIILNALKENNNNAELYSIDFSTEFCNDSSKLSGYATIDYATDELKKNWHLYTGNFVSEFLDEIGGDIDFAFIDTVHWNPGEIIDFLMVLPYLKEGATVLFHDINLHSNTGCPEMVTNCLLMSTIRGEKILPDRKDRKFLNIGGLILDKDIKEHLWEVFNCINMPWSYLPDIKSYETISRALERHYDKELCDIYHAKYNDYAETGLLNHYSSTDKRYSKRSYIIAEEDLEKYKSLPLKMKDGLSKARVFTKYLSIVNR